MTEPVHRVFPAGLAAFILLILAGLLASCQTESAPEGDHILTLSLADSLNRYDSVTVVIVDPRDTAAVLEAVWSGPLLFPSEIPPKKLTAAKNRAFAVKVIGYAAGGKTALRTLIYYENGKQKVVHEAVPPIVPSEWIKRLSPSAGSISPALSQDVLLYNLSLPEGVASVTLDVLPADTRAVVTVAGDTVKRGEGPKTLSVGAGSQTVPVTISIWGASRQYEVVMIPKSPVPVGLARIEAAEPAFLEPEFHADESFYFVHLPVGVDSTVMKFHPADPATMSMILTESGSSRPIIPGAPVKMRVPAGVEEYPFSVTVSRSGASKQYSIEIWRAH